MPRPKKVWSDRLLGAVEKLVDEHDVARLVFLLQRADGADADDPGDAELLHRPDVGAMIQFAGQNPVAAAVPRQEDHVAPGQLAGEQIVRGRAEGRFDLHPFLVVKPSMLYRPVPPMMPMRYSDMADV